MSQCHREDQGNYSSSSLCSLVKSRPLYQAQGGPSGSVPLVSSGRLNETTDVDVSHVMHRTTWLCQSLEPTVMALVTRYFQIPGGGLAAVQLNFEAPTPAPRRSPGPPSFARITNLQKMRTPNQYVESSALTYVVTKRRKKERPQLHMQQNFSATL